MIIDKNLISKRVSRIFYESVEITDLIYDGEIIITSPYNPQSNTLLNSIVIDVFINRLEEPIYTNVFKL